MNGLAKTRPPAKQRKVLADLRGQIVRGEFSPGDRLPTRMELESFYRVSGVTIQRALDRLCEDGFIQARGRHGTFVSRELPHTSRYGIVFSQSLDQREKWPRFWSLLHDILPDEQRRRSREMPVYCGVRDAPGTGDYDRIIEDLHDCRLAGLILTSSQCAIAGTPLSETTGVPKVLVRTQPAELALPQLLLNVARWIERALDHVVRQGRRRVAILWHGGQWNALVADPIARRAFAQRGLVYHRHLMQCADLGFPQSAQSLTQLLLDASRTDTPDALLVVDDNLVENALAGLALAGRKISQDITVVAHCNFPLACSGKSAVTQLGFDVRQALDACLRHIDSQRNRQPVDMVTSIDPVFEHELDERKLAGAPGSTPVHAKETDS